MSTIDLMKRAAGRRRYNAQRQFKADARRVVVAHLLRDQPDMPIGELARCLGVHRATIWRDRQCLELASRTDPSLAALLRSFFVPGMAPDGR